MPVSQIIDYFNDEMRVAPMRFLPEDPIRSSYGAVEGYFGPLRLTSVFQPLVAIAASGRLVVGHQAYLRAIGANYAALPAPEVFASAREAAAIVYLDRLCRTVHMLNFLRQANNDTCLFLHLHARHILGLPHEHGEYFEGLLHRCGLIPERIVIQSDPPSTGDADERRRPGGRRASIRKPHSGRYGTVSGRRCFLTLCIIVIYSYKQSSARLRNMAPFPEFLFAESSHPGRQAPLDAPIPAVLTLP